MVGNLRAAKKYRFIIHVCGVSGFLSLWLTVVKCPIGLRVPKVGMIRFRRGGQWGIARLRT